MVFLEKREGNCHVLFPVLRLMTIWLPYGLLRGDGGRLSVISFISSAREVYTHVWNLVTIWLS